MSVLFAGVRSRAQSDPAAVCRADAGSYPRSHAPTLVAQGAVAIPRCLVAANTTANPSCRARLARDP